MTPWPTLTDPALTERLALPHDAFRAMVYAFLEAFEIPPYDDAFHARAIGYPWERPAGSFVLDGDHVITTGLPAAAAAVFAGGDGAPRYPLLAIGSNGAPSTLVRKFAHLPPAERRLVAVAGHLHGFDVGPAARVTPYGSLPATLFASPGTAVRASVLWVTAAQLTALTWTELSYFLGRLLPAEFEPDDEAADAVGTPRVDHALLYVSRWGNLTIDGAPVALGALPARGRTAPAHTQLELLDHVARVGFGPTASAASLHQQLTTDLAGTIRHLDDRILACAAPFEHASWARFPGG